MAMCGHKLLGTCGQQADGSSSHARLLLKLTQLSEQDCSWMLCLKRPCMTLAGESFGQRQLQWGGAGTGLCVFTEAAQLPAQQAVVQHPHRPARRESAPKSLCACKSMGKVGVLHCCVLLGAANRSCAP